MIKIRHLLFVAALSVPPGMARSQARGIAVPIVGTWLLESIVDSLPDHSVTYWMGQHPTGAIVYALSGHVSAQFMRDPRPQMRAVDSAVAAQRTSARPFEGASLDEMQQIAQGYYAYFGTYTLNAAGDSVTHQVEISLRPAEVGRTYRRAIRLVGDRLVISLDATEAGIPVHRVLTWRRTPDRTGRPNDR